MKLYNDNMEIIKEYRKNLYDGLLNEKKQDEKRIEKTISVKTRDKIFSIEVYKETDCFRLNSIYHPEYEANIWSDSLDLNGIENVISVFGFSNGLYIRKILDKIDKQDVILIYEPSMMIFKHVIENYDIKDILKDKRVLIAIESINKEEFRQSLQNRVYWTNIYSQKIYIMPQYDILFSKSFNEFEGIIRANNDRTVMFRNSDSLFGRVVVDNTFDNLKYLDSCNIISEYIGKFPKDVPAIIVSAGPSLDKNIEKLKKVNKRAVIFGIDRSLEYLYKHGIEPDFAVTVDPLKPVKYFAGEYKVKVPLFAELHSNQQILNLHDGNKIFYNAFGYINTVLSKFNKQIEPKVPIGTSVATATFALCIAMKFKRIILIGQDLAYSEVGNSTHAGGINTEEFHFEELWVDGVNGNKVRTRHDWFEFINWFGDMVEQHPEVEIVDATEGGAKIRGTKIMTLNDAIDKYCINQFDCNKLNNNMEPIYKRNEINEISDSIKKSKMELEQIKVKAKDALNACEKMIINCRKNLDENKASKGLVKKISKANKFIINKPIYSMIDAYITEATSTNMKYIYQITEDSMADKILTFVNGKDLYEQIIKATDDINELIDNKKIIEKLNM